MISVENKYIFLLTPLILLLFILDYKNRSQYTHKLSLFNILQKGLFHTFFDLEKILLYSTLFYLLFILAGINIRVSENNETYIIFNMPYITNAVLEKTKDIVKQQIGIVGKINIYVNDHYIGKYSLVDINTKLFEKKGIFDNFYLDYIPVNDDKNGKIVVIKFCSLGSVKSETNTYRICIKDMDNLGIIKKILERIFLFNYSNTNKKVKIRIDKNISEVLLEPNKITELKTQKNINSIEVVWQDEFLPDNYFSNRQIRIYIGEELTYTIKALKALGYDLTTSKEYDLCIYKKGTEVTQHCKYRWELTPSTFYHFDGLVLVPGKYRNLTLSNLILPTNFDINKITFKNVLKLNSEGYDRIIPFITTDKDEVVMGLYTKNGQQYVISGFNWEETSQTDFAQNPDAPLPVFIDAVLHYLFFEHYSKERNYIGNKLFSYYNSSFPDVIFKNITPYSHTIALSPIFKYLTFITFIFYILLKIIL